MPSLPPGSTIPVNLSKLCTTGGRGLNLPAWGKACIRHTVAATVGETVNSLTGLFWPGHRTGGSSSALPTTCDTTAVAPTTHRTSRLYPFAYTTCWRFFPFIKCRFVFDKYIDRKVMYRVAHKSLNDLMRLYVLINKV